MQIDTIIQHFRQIVLIDDDLINNMLSRKLLLRFYQPNTVTITAFEDPKEGLGYLQNHLSNDSPLLVFLDLKMPVLSGWDVLDELKTMKRSLTENITLFLLTSSIDENDKLRAKQYSLVNGFLAKPLISHLPKPAGNKIEL